MRAGAYSDLQEIGRGGMGVVFRARGPEGRFVALKVLKRLDPDSLARFDRERRMVATLGEAEGFVPLLDAGELGGPFIVMPFLEGGTLRARLMRGPLPVAEACALVRSLALALGEAHERGIVHRDLKPENVLFTRRGDEDGDWGRALVADLGLAKHFDHQGASISLSIEGTMRGTAGYMPPEQARDAKNAGPPADVFALGAILYECLSGTPPFHGSSLTEVLVRVEEGRYEPLARLCPGAPRWLVALVERCLARDPLRRFADGAELAAALAAGPTVATRRGRRLALVGAVLGGAALAAAVLRARPAPVAADAGASSVAPARSAASPAGFPAFCQKVLRSKATRLLQVWGTCERKHAASVLSVAVSPDGRRAVTGDAEGGVAVWDLEAAFSGRGERRELLQVLAGEKGAVIRVAFGADGRRVVGVSRDGRLCLWSETGALLASVEQGVEVTAAAVLPDGLQVLTAAGDGPLRLWNLDEKRLVKTIAPMDPKNARISALAPMPDGHAVLRGSVGGALGLVLIEPGEWGWNLEEAGGPLTMIAVSPDGSRVLSAYVNRSSRMGLAEASPVGKGDDWKSVKLEGMVGIGVSGALSRDAKHALVATQDGTIGLWDVATGGKLGVAQAHAGGATSVAFLPDGERAVSVGMDRVLRLWDLRMALDRRGGLVEVCNPGGPAWPLEAVAVSPDGTHAALGCADGTVRFLGLARPGATPGGEWRPGPALEEARIAGPGGATSCVVFTRAGEHVLAGGSEGSVLAWSVAAALRGGEVAPVGSFSAHQGVVRALAVSPDGERLLTGGSDAAARLWDMHAILTTAGIVEQFQTLSGNMGDVMSVAFMPDGKIGFTAGTEGGLRTWDLASGERILRFDSDVGEVRTALGPDGLWALAGRGDDRTVTLWRFALEGPRTLGRHEGPVKGVALTPDGARGVTVGLAGDVKVWDTVHGLEVDALSLGTGDAILAVAIAPDGRSFVVATARGVVLQFEMRG